jgi:hypothetical protein
MICCSLALWFKVSVFESDCRQTINLQKTHTLDVILYCVPVTENMNYHVSPWKGCFQDLASLIRCVESMFFIHGSHLFWHGLNCRSNIMLTQSSFTINWPIINFIVGFVCYFWLIVFDGQQYSWLVMETWRYFDSHPEYSCLPTSESAVASCVPFRRGPYWLKPSDSAAVLRYGWGSSYKFML